MRVSVAEKASKGYALFDLDQTLAPWDMQLLFANWIFHKHPFRRLYLAPFLITMPLAKVLGARRMKRLFLGILCGLSSQEVEEICIEFSDYYCPKIFYPEIVALLKEHQEKGHLCVLTSASPYLYVQHIGRKLEFDQTFGTMVGEADFMPLIPEISDNNKSVVKIERLRRWLNDHSISDAYPLPGSTAYTDSTADLPLIEVSERAVLINPSENLKNAVEQTLQKPFVVHTPKRPFKSDWGHFCAAVQKLLGIYPI